MNLTQFNYKLFLTCILVCICSLNGYTQEYRRLRFIFGGGQSSSSGSEIFFYEPSVRITKRITLGLKREIFIPSNARSGTSTSLNVQYYLFPNQGGFLFGKRFRLFVGLGVSSNTRSASLNPATVFFPNGSSQNIYPLEINDQFVPGFYPRLGFDYKHITFNLEYNFVQRLRVTLYHYDAQTAQFIGYSSRYVDSNYLGLKLGFFIGGGLKK